MEDINWKSNYEPYIRQYNLVNTLLIVTKRMCIYENVINRGHRWERGFNRVIMDMERVSLQGYMGIVFEEH